MAKADRIVRELLGPEAVLLTCPLELARLDGLRERTGPLLLVSADLDDPLPTWSPTGGARKLRERVKGWVALAELIASEPRLGKALAGTRTWLPTRTALRSPRLAPPLELLVGALGRNTRNKLNWTFASSGTLDATLYGFNGLTHEGLQLRLTHEGLERWPSLDPGPQSHLDKRYPVVWVLRPEDVPQLVAGLE